jgi:hypothetical protein
MPVALFIVENIVVLKLADCSVKFREMNNKTAGELKVK